MTKTPLVTVCMPTYNHGFYVEAAILSIINQDYPNIQLIISDDCSTDNTISILQSYKDKYPQIIELQLHAKNLGIEGNVESIYSLIQGDYVCWFSGDDLFLPGKISTQVKLMLDNPHSIYSFHAVNVVNEAAEFLYTFNDPLLGIKLHTSNIADNLLKYRCFICANSVMINRKLAKDLKHNFKLGMCADWFLLFELALHGEIIYMPETLVSYRRHSSNISKSINIANEKKIYIYVLEHYPALKANVYIGLSQLYATYMFKYLLKKNFKMSLYCAKDLLVTLLRYPQNVGYVFTKLYTEIIKRSKLLMLTGNVIR